jgi:hypothetical protein
MSTTTTRLTYYNGIMWHSVLLPGAATRYYRGPARVSGAAHRQLALAVSDW